MPSQLDDHIVSAVREIIRKVREDEDPDLLNNYRRAFRKAVPWGLRSWVIGYLLKEALKGGPVRLPGGTTLFVSVGKNRRVYPKDLIHLFINTGKVQRSDIGEIKILDNYSFVTVAEGVAGDLIGNLDGIPYRGRNLTVNYAKKKNTAPRD